MSYQLKKNDSHPISIDYGDDQFTLRILDKVNTVTYTPLDSFSLKIVSSFLNKYKKPRERMKLKHYSKKILF